MTDKMLCNVDKQQPTSPA